MGGLGILKVIMYGPLACLEAVGYGYFNCLLTGSVLVLKRIA
jgi:hypothetical protein